ncbi:MAG: arsenic transporter [Firmicutes bacterium]|nr:arsenic transporter [Bacillota bacterium]
MSAIAASSIFVATLVFVLWQPRGFPIGYTALIGGAVALASGVVHLSEIPQVLGIVWDATLSFVAIILISSMLDQLGFFTWAALHVARLGAGKPVRTLVLILCLGAGVAALFANDGAALILTPIVFEMMRALGAPPRTIFAFVISCGFVADTTSLPLVVSNLVNIVSADFFHIGFLAYARVMLVPTLISLAATVGVLVLFFYRDLPGHFEVARLDEPRSALRDPSLLRLAWIVLGLLLAGYIVGALVHLPVSLVAWGAAFLLMAATRRRKALPLRRLLREAPWQVVLFSVGMYVVVWGMHSAGITAYLARLLQTLSAHGPWAATLGGGMVTAALSAAMNNMPTVMIGALSIGSLDGVTPTVQQLLLYANIVGADLGPKFTPIGSLATLLWLHTLAQRGVQIRFGSYMATGLKLTPPVLLATLAALCGWVLWLH